MMGALKHKQVWKKQNVHRPCYVNYKFKQSSSSIDNHKSMQHDDSSSSLQKSSSIVVNRTQDISNNIFRLPIKKRNIHFNERVSVLLIPCRQDYLEANLTNVVWWKSPDYKRFQFDAYSELKESLKGEILNASNVKQALKQLYQNENELKMNTLMNMTVGSDTADMVPESNNTSEFPVAVKVHRYDDYKRYDTILNSITTSASSITNACPVHETVNMHHLGMNSDSIMYANNSNFSVITI